MPYSLMTRFFAKNVFIALILAIYSQAVFASKVVVIGMGPAGLLAAYHQLKLGQQVTIIEQREEPFTRYGRAALSRDFLNHVMRHLSNYSLNGYSLKMPELHTGAYEINLVQKQTSPQAPMLAVSAADQDFLELVISNHRALSVQQVQNYLLQKIENKRGLEIIRPATIKRINATSGEVILENHPQAISFDELIIADGTSRRATALLFGSIDKELKPTSLPLPHRNHTKYAMTRINLLNTDPEVIARIKPRSIISPAVFNSSNLSSSHLAILKGLGWDQDYLPVVAVQYIEKDQQFYLFTEIPEDWYKLSEQEFFNTFQQFAHVLLKIEHPVLMQSEQAFFMQNQATAFTVAPNTINTPILYLGNKRHAFIIGDALFTPHILFGHGMRNAARGALAVAKCFDMNGKFKSEEPMAELLKDLHNDYKTMNRRCKLMLYLDQYPTAKKSLLYLVDRYNQLKTEIF